MNGPTCLEEDGARSPAGPGFGFRAAAIATFTGQDLFTTCPVGNITPASARKFVFVKWPPEAIREWTATDVPYAILVK